MKEAYEAAEMELIAFEAEDVITTSPDCPRDGLCANETERDCIFE